MDRLGIFILSVLFTACMNDNTGRQDPELLDKGQFPQKWELVAMTGMVANVPPAKGDEMDWQEHYVLEADGSFVKSRDWSEEQLTATGHYEILELEDGAYLKLTYGADQKIIGNCSSKPEEYLRFETSNTLIGTWWACDGPGLFYKRTN